MGRKTTEWILKATNWTGYRWEDGVVFVVPMVKAMKCGIVESEIKHQSVDYIHYRANIIGKDMKHIIIPAMG